MYSILLYLHIFITILEKLRPFKHYRKKKISAFLLCTHLSYLIKSCKACRLQVMSISLVDWWWWEVVLLKKVGSKHKPYGLGRILSYLLILIFPSNYACPLCTFLLKCENSLYLKGSSFFQNNCLKINFHKSITFKGSVTIRLLSAEIVFFPVRETEENKVLPPASYSKETYSNNSFGTLCEVLNFQLSETSMSYFTAFWSEENSRGEKHCLWCT